MRREADDSEGRLPLCIFKRALPEQRFSYQLLTSAYLYHITDPQFGGRRENNAVARDKTRRDLDLIAFDRVQSDNAVGTPVAFDNQERDGRSATQFGVHRKSRGRHPDARAARAPQANIDPRSRHESCSADDVGQIAERVACGVSYGVAAPDARLRDDVRVINERKVDEASGREAHHLGLRHLKSNDERRELPDLEEPFIAGDARAETNVAVRDNACDRSAHNTFVGLDARGFNSDLRGLGGDARLFMLSCRGVKSELRPLKVALARNAVPVKCRLAL